jgi:MinD superfamily P-loop ATPase
MRRVKEIVVVSGKGGTGKTSLVAALAMLLKDKVVADCDVDAANLNLVLNGTITEEHEFIAGKKAKIDPEKCNACGKCREICRFDAISEDFFVDRLACEGCGACFFFCPAEAVTFSDTLSGHLYVGEMNGTGPIVFAELLPGGENSGKLVTEVRTKARSLAETNGRELILIDGPPGIGCPVISSLTGVSLAIMVTEPTMTGVHDLERVAGLTRHFQIPGAVVINKGDINPDYAKNISDFCETHNLLLLGTIPYDVQITEAQRQGKTILDFAPDSPASKEILAISKKIKERVERL